MPMVAQQAPYTLFILDDEDAHCPREDRDNFGTMVCFHNRYSLGDEHNYSEPSDFLKELMLHIVFWDRTQTIAKTYVPPKVANDVRIALIKSTFEEKIKTLYEQKKLDKENVGKSFDEAVLDFDSFIKDMRAKRFKAVKSEFDTYSDGKRINITQLFNSDEQLASMAEKLFRLRTLIPKGGRVAYKLLPPEVKVEIDSLADELIKNNTYLKNAIEHYIDSQCKLKELYSSLDDPDKLKAYRDKCEGEAKNQICSKLVKSVKAIISKEYEIKTEEWTAARKQYFAMECMREILQFFANGIVDNHSAIYEKHGLGFGDLSERAMKEWYLKNKDNDEQIAELIKSGYDGLNFMKEV